MTNIVKVVVTFGVVVVLTLLGFIAYSLHQVSARQAAIQTEQIAQRQLIDGVVGSQTSWASKQDIANLLASNGVNAQALAAIQQDMATVKANLTTANVVTVNSQSQILANQSSTSIGPANPSPPTTVTLTCTPGGSVTCPNPDPYGFMAAQQNYTLSEKFGTLTVPIGSVGFSSFQAKPWSENILPRQYTVDNIIGTDENERNYVYNQFNIITGGKTYNIPITTSITKQIYPTAKFSLWNPRLLLGLDGGINASRGTGEVAPSVSLGIMSYGMYKTTPDWSILEVGAAYQAVNGHPALVVTPVAYNIGRNVFSPLANNTYIGPSVMLATDGSWTFAAGIRVGF